MPADTNPAAGLDALTGSRVTGVDRSDNLVEIRFARGDDRFVLRAYCPLRVVVGGRIVVGTADCQCPADREVDPVAAYASRTTVFDRNARRLSALLAEREITVASALVADATGMVVIRSAGNLRIDLVPACSGPVNAWRLSTVNAAVDSTVDAAVDSTVLAEYPPARRKA
ncbi:hypothetical protein [Actinokineospora sp. NBRC 105648]|uniref:hypothetical protein n=1 Tax=Actinokineospora sp. NBRC 105648 TaxID=3032206 RepID=UPI0024A4EC98|nr:hypothetical protein [Actinokineospora sp. NBRC 105648]GLZ37138.1 hypothetical protein Acsp05_07630 [Actinokineospora sp. NBRC 105648]